MPRSIISRKNCGLRRNFFAPEITPNFVNLWASPAFPPALPFSTRRHSSYCRLAINSCSLLQIVPKPTLVVRWMSAASLVSRRCSRSAPRSHRGCLSKPNHRTCNAYCRFIPLMLLCLFHSVRSGGRLGATEARTVAPAAPGSRQNIPQHRFVTHRAFRRVLPPYGGLRSFLPAEPPVLSPLRGPGEEQNRPVSAEQEKENVRQRNLNSTYTSC